MLVPNKSRPRPLLFGVLLLLAFSFLGVISFQPARAFVSTVASTAHTSGSTTLLTQTISHNYAAVGNVVIVGITEQFSTQTIADNLPTTNPTFGASVPTDSCGDVFVFDGNELTQLTATPNYLSMGMQLWSAKTLCTSANTITFTFTIKSNWSAPAIELVEITNAVAPFLSVSTGNVAQKNPQGGSIAYPAGSVVVGFGNGWNPTTVTAGSGYTLVNALMEYSTTSPSPDPAAFASTGVPGTWAEIDAAFGTPASSTVTVTSVNNTSCLGACSGGNNGTGTYFTVGMPGLFVFYASQNTPSNAQVDNVTLKVKAVHINANTGTCYVAVYTAGTTLPSGGNPYTLVGPATTVAVTNGTSNFFIHTNPQVNLAPSVYYAVGFMCGTTKSNSASVISSGVSLYETSQVGITEYQYNTGATSPPASFYSSTTMTPNFFIYIHTTFTVASTTVTSTSTVGGTATTTQTITSTTLDMNLAVNSGVDYSILLLVILLPAFALMVPIAVFTKSAQGAGIGFVAGLMLGSALGVQASIVPPVFLGISVIVGVFLIVGLSRSGGGGVP